MIESATAINNLPSHAMRADFVQHSEQLVTLTYGQLQELITQAVQKAIQPLHDEVSHLKATVASQGEKIVALEATQDTLSENQLIQLQLIHRMREESRQATPDATKPTKKTSTHIDEIALILANRERTLIHGNAPKSYLAKLRKEGMTFSQLASVLGLTIDRIRQLSRIAATDLRFNVCWHPRKKNTKIIKLRRWDAPGL